MAYETGGSSSVNDLIDKLRIFAIAQGWTVDYFAVFTGSNYALLISKAGKSYAFFTSVGAGNADDPGSYMGCAQYPGPYNSGQAANAQTNLSTQTYANNLPGPFQAYHFFAGTNLAGDSYLHIVVESQAGSYRHFGIGVIDKLGAITTGQYNYACRWNYNAFYGPGAINGYKSVPWDGQENSSINGWRGTIIRCDSDTYSPRYGYANAVDATDRMLGGIFSGRNASGYGSIGKSSLTGRAILVPICMEIRRPSNYYTPIGGPADIRFVDMTNLLPGELISLGADQWRIFPIIRKNGLNESSGNWGYAYKVVP